MHTSCRNSYAFQCHEIFGCCVWRILSTSFFNEHLKANCHFKQWLEKNKNCLSKNVSSTAKQWRVKFTCKKIHVYTNWDLCHILLKLYKIIRYYKQKVWMCLPWSWQHYTMHDVFMSSWTKYISFMICELYWLHGRLYYIHIHIENHYLSF